MSALPRPEPTLLQIIRDDVRYGAPGAHLEVPDVPRWVAELNGISSSLAVSDMAGCMTDAIAELNIKDKRRERINALLAGLMDDTRLDQVVELRDLLRQLLVDYCIGQAQALVDREFP